MKSSERRMSAGWSFAAGTLLGALAVLVPLASLGISPLKARGAGVRPSVAVEPAARASVSETVTAPNARESASIRQSVPATFNRRGSNAASVRQESSRHWELDLQLD